MKPDDYITKLSHCVKKVSVLVIVINDGKITNSSGWEDIANHVITQSPQWKKHPYSSSSSSFIKQEPPMKQLMEDFVALFCVVDNLNVDVGRLRAIAQSIFDHEVDVLKAAGTSIVNGLARAQHLYPQQSVSSFEFNPAKMKCTVKYYFTKILIKTLQHEPFEAEQILKEKLNLDSYIDFWTRSEAIRLILYYIHSLNNNNNNNNDSTSIGCKIGEECEVRVVDICVVTLSSTIMSVLSNEQGISDEMYWKLGVEFTEKIIFKAYPNVSQPIKLSLNKVSGSTILKHVEQIVNDAKIYQNSFKLEEMIMNQKDEKEKTSFIIQIMKQYLAATVTNEIFSNSLLSGGYHLQDYNNTRVHGNGKLDNLDANKFGNVYPKSLIEEAPSRGLLLVGEASWKQSSQALVEYFDNIDKGNKGGTIYIPNSPPSDPNSPLKLREEYQEHVIKVVMDAVVKHVVEGGETAVQLGVQNRTGNMISYKVKVEFSQSNTAEFKQKMTSYIFLMFTSIGHFFTKDKKINHRTSIPGHWRKKTHRISLRKNNNKSQRQQPNLSINNINNIQQFIEESQQFISPFDAYILSCKDVILVYHFGHFTLIADENHNVFISCVEFMENIGYGLTVKRIRNKVNLEIDYAKVLVKDGGHRIEITKWSMSDYSTNNKSDGHYAVTVPVRAINIDTNSPEEFTVKLVVSSHITAQKLYDQIVRYYGAYSDHHLPSSISTSLSLSTTDKNETSSPNIDELMVDIHNEFNDHSKKHGYSHGLREIKFQTIIDNLCENNNNNVRQAFADPEIRKVIIFAVTSNIKEVYNQIWVACKFKGCRNRNIRYPSNDKRVHETARHGRVQFEDVKHCGMDVIKYMKDQNRTSMTMEEIKTYWIKKQDNNNILFDDEHCKKIWNAFINEIQACSNDQEAFCNKLYCNHLVSSNILLLS